MKILLKINKNIAKTNICTESEIKTEALAIKMERVKKIDSQHSVRRDMAYGRLKQFSHIYFTKSPVQLGRKVFTVCRSCY